MDVIEIITQVAEASIGIAALVVLAIVVMSWAKGRGADNDVITTMAALLTNSQAGLEELSKQTAASHAALEAIRATLERSNEIDERTIAALDKNTAVVQASIADGLASREHMHKAVAGLREQMDADKGDLLARLDALEQSVLAGFTDLGRQVETLNAVRVEEDRANQTRMNKTLGEVLSVIHELRRMVQVTTPQEAEKAA